MDHMALQRKSRLDSTVHNFHEDPYPCIRMKRNTSRIYAFRPTHSLPHPDKGFLLFYLFSLSVHYAPPYATPACGLLSKGNNKRGTLTNIHPRTQQISSPICNCLWRVSRRGEQLHRNRALRRDYCTPVTSVRDGIGPNVYPTISQNMTTGKKAYKEIPMEIVSRPI